MLPAVESRPVRGKEKEIPGKCPAISAVRPGLGELPTAERCGYDHLLSFWGGLRGAAVLLSDGQHTV
jgi:hypothetical protein